MTFSRQQINLSLAIILALTALLWIGVGGIDLNCGDYLYIGSIAPIHFSNLFRPFIVTDPNPMWYRPFANATFSMNFLLSQWNGGPYHLTNLLLHLLATGTVFYFARSIFGMSNGLALILSLAFGLNASHDFNLTLDADRDDMLVALFIMWTFLAERKAQREARPAWSVVAVISYAFALCSKESAYFVLPLIPWFCLPSGTNRKECTVKSIYMVAPYLALAVAFMIVHAHYGAAPTENPFAQLLTPKGLFRDISGNIMGAGYILLPLDFHSALIALHQYLPIFIVIAGLLAIVAIWILWENKSSEAVRRMMKPVVLFLITTLPIVSFARWRFYFPSVALLFLVVEFSFLFWRRGLATRILLVVAVLPLAAYHIREALADQADAQAATHLITSSVPQFSSILGQIPQRPVTLGLISAPAKVGDAECMPSAQQSVVQFSEALRTHAPSVQDGVIALAKVSAWSAVLLYSFDRDAGFRWIETEQLGKFHFVVRTSSVKKMMIVPSEDANRGLSPLRLQFHSGDTVQSAQCLCTIINASGGMATAIDVRFIDTSAIPVMFNGKDYAITGQGIH